MLVAAGSAAFATEWILYLVGRYSDDPSDWIVSVGLYGLFHGYDFWNAQRAVDRSRVAALELRKAIEAMYVIDLDALRGADAAKVYDFDLGNTGGVLGLPGGVLPNNTAVYVDWLCAAALSLAGLGSGASVKLLLQ